ncbi:MAG TPA: hypothetical protein VFN21_01470 [Acidimicrobiales bacterium]|nr:hypothetical protein [Acidimicrobiales bacterium]
MARQQLHLIEVPQPSLERDIRPRDTRLDERTKAIGRAGLAQARAALAAADNRRTPRKHPDRPGRPTAA